MSLWKIWGCHQVGCLPFSSVKVRNKQTNANSWPEQNLVNQSSVAETVVCISRPHLNQCSNVNVWYRLGLSSILFALVRQHFGCIAVPPRLTQAGLCRCPPHRATGELSLPWCRKLARALLLHRPGCVWLLCGCYSIPLSVWVYHLIFLGLCLSTVQLG